MIKKIWTTIRGWWNKWRDPSRALEKQYSKLLVEGRNLQRKGDIPAFAAKTREADDLRKKIDNLKEKS